jgi:hypothetical protein
MKAWPFAALLVAAAACGGESKNDLFDNPGSGGSGASGGKGSGGSTGGSGTGGTTGGTASGGAGTGGKATGGAGAAMTGGKGGSMATGGTGGAAGNGGAMTTGGNGGSTAAGTGGRAGAGATGGASMAGVGGGSAGAGGRGMAGASGAAPTCDGLADAYAEALESALACDPSIDSVQCMHHVPASLPCGCPIHVNPDNEEAVAELERLQEQHDKMGCVIVCPDILCIDGESFCSTSGTGNMGRCVEGDAAK